MKTTLNHLQINVAAASLPFYKDLFGVLGWKTLHEAEGMAGYGTAQGASAWFIGEANDAKNDYDGRGMNHFAFGAESQADVDAAAAYLADKGITALFETPRHRPEFAMSETETYYQLMFESPDRVLFEVVYTGPKS